MGDDTLNGLIIQLNMFFSDAVFNQLPWQKITVCYFQLFFQGVACKPDDLHPVEKGGRDGVGEISRSDKHYLGKIERNVHIVI